VVLGLGEAARRAAPPTVAVGQIVTAVPGTDEVDVHGRLAVYRPDSGPAPAAVHRGGLFELDMAGLEGRTRRLVMTDLDAWHLENLELPAGVRLGSFRFTARTPRPVSAVVRFGSAGVEGKLAAEPFRELGDAVLYAPGSRPLAVRLDGKGRFRSGSRDALPAGQFLASPVLSDRQQRRQALYRDFLKQRRDGHRRGQPVLLVWADPIDLHFTLAREARRVGDALLVIPLRLERPPPGARVTVPGALVPFRRIIAGRSAPATLESDQATTMQLRFQLPDSVLPLTVERARLTAKIIAPGRRLTITAGPGTPRGELLRVESPLDPIRLDLTDKRLLRPDADGGLHLTVALGSTIKRGRLKPGQARRVQKWKIEYLELEVTGSMSPR
jgi:hypothetical protein